MTPVRALRARTTTIALRVGGALFFAVGAVGIVVPLLPTVVFWILAVWCWSVSAPAWSERLACSLIRASGTRSGTSSNTD